MKKRLVLVLLLATGPAWAQTALPPPSFHHLMLNTVDPEAAIAFYTKAFPSTKRTTWAGYPAILVVGLALGAASAGAADSAAPKSVG